MVHLRAVRIGALSRLVGGVLLLALIAAATLLRPTAAFGADHSSFSVTAPVEGSLSARPGDIVRPSLTVMNMLDEPAVYRLEIRSIEAGDEGVVKIADKSDELTSAASVDATLAVAPHESASAMLTLPVPKDLEPGTHLIGIIVTPIVDGSGVDNHLQILSHVTLTVAGTGPTSALAVDQHVNHRWMFGGSLHGKYALVDNSVEGITVRHGVAMNVQPGSDKVITRPGEPGTFLFGAHKKTFSYQYRPGLIAVGVVHPVVHASYNGADHSYRGPAVFVVTPLALILLLLLLIGGPLLLRLLRRKKRSLLTVTAVSLVLGSLALPMTANAAALTSVNFTTSKSQVGDTSVRYGWSFTTASTASISSITFTVPSGTAGASLTVADNYGIGAGTAALAGTTVTYTVTTPVSIAAGTPILITLDGFTNTSTPGTYTSDVSTVTDGPTTSSTSTTITSNTVTFNVTVNPALSFSNSANSIPVHLASVDDQTYPTTLTVASNAASGYSLLAQATSLTVSGKTIATTSAGVSSGFASGSFPVNSWGYTVGVPSNGGSGTITRQGALASGQYVGYASSAETFLIQSGPTAGDSAVVTNRFKIDATQAAGTYAATLTFTAIPTY